MVDHIFARSVIVVDKICEHLVDFHFDCLRNLYQKLFVEFFCLKEMIYTGSAGIWCETRTGGPLPSLQPGWSARQVFYLIFLYI